MDYRLGPLARARYILALGNPRRSSTTFGLLLASSALAADPVIPPPADPLTVEMETGDADRFAALFEAAGGTLSAERLQRDYMDRGSYGVKVFTPNRIKDAADLVNRGAAKPGVYARAARTCLPIVNQTTAELRATYLALHGLFPDKPLPQLFLVVGAGNSGGTAAPGAQVLGLEVLWRGATTPDALRAIVRGFYAHETTHPLQGGLPAGNTLLASVLQEGAADFIAELATGRPMDQARADWAMPREAELWKQFEADLKATRGATAETELKPGTPASEPSIVGSPITTARRRAVPVRLVTGWDNAFGSAGVTSSRTDALRCTIYLCRRTPRLSLRRGPSGRTEQPKPSRRASWSRSRLSVRQWA